MLYFPLYYSVGPPCNLTIPAPRTILNTSASVVTTADEAEITTDGESVNRNSTVSSSFATTAAMSPIERLVQRYSQIVIDPVSFEILNVHFSIF